MKQSRGIHKWKRHLNGVRIDVTKIPQGERLLKDFERLRQLNVCQVPAILLP